MFDFNLWTMGTKGSMRVEAGAQRRIPRAYSTCKNGHCAPRAHPAVDFWKKRQRERGAVAAATGADAYEMNPSDWASDAGIATGCAAAGGISSGGGMPLAVSNGCNDE